MYVSNEGKEIIVLIAEYGFVAVLEKMSLTAMPAVKVLGVPGKKFSHDGCYAAFTASEQNMNMIVHEDPGVNGTFSILNILSEAFKEPGFILYVTENI
jgi:hypothetical protein